MAFFGQILMTTKKGIFLKVKIVYLNKRYYLYVVI